MREARGRRGGAGAAGIAAALLLAAAGPARAADPARGGEFFALCQACHSLGEEHGVGPSLRGVVGRAAGALPDFRYSPAMRRVSLVWTIETLDRFMADPQAVIRGNRMPFDGITDPTIRADLAAFLAGGAAIPLADTMPAQ
jgi:cytochrome c2